MKVLLLSTNLDLPEAYLIRGLKEKGLQITLVLGRSSPFLEVLEGTGIEIIYWNFKYRIHPASALFVRKLMLKEKFDIIHTFNARALTSALLAAISLPVKQVTYRGTTGHLSRFDPAAWLSYFHPRVNKILCVSEAVKKYLHSKGISENKLCRIYKGHAPAWYAISENVNRQQYGFDKDEFLVACSANMRAVKGVDLLIQSLRFINKNIPLRLVLIGQVRDERVLKLVEENDWSDRVNFMGFRIDAASIVSVCDIFCMPSRKREGLPKALIEAMIQGIAPIVTNVGGMPELVEHEVSGLVVKEESPQSIADAIVKLYNNSDIRAAYAQAAKEKIIKQFSITNTIEQTYQVYKEILA